MHISIKGSIGGFALISLTVCGTLSGGPEPLSSRPEPKFATGEF